MSSKNLPKSQVKIKPLFLQYPSLTIFNPKKVSREQIYNFKFLSHYEAIQYCI